MGKSVQYLIHTYPKRMWYVRDFLIPSMLEQGIKEKQIIVYNDKYREGELVSFLKSYDYTQNKDTWHLQDDVIISKRFKEVTYEYTGIACGFCNSYSTGQPGRTNVWEMWYSMPCIRLPGDILKHFIEWMHTPEVGKRFRHYFMENKHDDVFLQFFLRENYTKEIVWNIAPNIVNHIDHLIGGSIINKDRPKTTSEIMSSYWDEPELLEDIEHRLKEY